MGEAYANQLVKHSIEECVRLRLSFSNTIQPFPDWTSILPNNQWQTYQNPQFMEGQNFFVRKQDRPDPDGFDRDLNVIDFNILTNPNLLFNGEHAILIYEFNPEQLSEGRYIWINNDTPVELRRWKQIVFSCMNYNQNEVGNLNGCRCVFGWQCANATEFRGRRGTVNTPRRRTRSFDNQYAEQLAIRTNRMWPKVDDHFIGIIIFQHL
jgi:hypothetical protein